MDGHNVGITEELEFFDARASLSLRFFGGQVLAPGDGLHSECLTDARHLAPEPSQADDTEDLFFQAKAKRGLPAAAAQRLVLSHDPARKGQDQTPGKLGGRRAAGLGAANENAALGTSHHVDAEIAPAGGDDELEIGKALYERALERRPFAGQDKNFKRLDPANQILAFEVLVEDHHRRARTQTIPFGERARHALKIIEDGDRNGHGDLVLFREARIAFVSSPAAGGSSRNANASLSMRVGKSGSLVASPSRSVVSAG